MQVRITDDNQVKYAARTTLKNKNTARLDRPLQDSMKMSGGAAAEFFKASNASVPASAKTDAEGSGTGEMAT